MNPTNSSQIVNLHVSHFRLEACKVSHKVLRKHLSLEKSTTQICCQSLFLSHILSGPSMPTPAVLFRVKMSLPKKIISFEMSAYLFNTMTYLL